MELKTLEETDVSNETLLYSSMKGSILTICNKKRKISLDSESVGDADCTKTEDVSIGIPSPCSAETIIDPLTNCIPVVSKLDSNNCVQTAQNINEIPGITSDSLTASFPQNSENVLLQSVIKSEVGIPRNTQTSDSVCNETNNHDLQESSHGDCIADTSETSSADSLDSSFYLESRRTRRNSKLTKVCCPVCSVTVRQPELESHYAQEVEKLSKIPKTITKPRRDDSGISTTYVRVKSNRENRLTAKVAKYAAKAKQEVPCPICKVRMTGSAEEINKHVVLCVQNEEDNDEHVVVDDEEEEDESFSEYEIGDQTRVRVVSLVPGGYRGLQLHTARHNTLAEDEDLDVDVDDTIAYGQPQYTELDVIPNNFGGIDKAQEELRKAVLNDPTAQPKVLESRKWSESTDGETSNIMNSNEISVDTRVDVKDNSTTEEEKNAPADHIVSSLKEKIKDLEDQNNSVKCLICMESYTKPVVSTTCWHVHCEECWLMTMGVKKLCPQCNMIVFPSDLRKIYL